MCYEEPTTELAKPSGRGPGGLFAKGNKIAVGHRAPHARQAALLRAEMFRCVTPQEMAAVIRAMLDRAKDGDTAAAKIIFQWTLGEPVALDLLERLERLERSLITRVEDVEPSDQTSGD